MPRRYLSLSIILLFCFFVGCEEPPKSPISTIPQILIDYIEETEETKIYAHGIEDTLYSNITIQINHDTKKENFTYSLHLSTLLKDFMLNISVWDESRDYEYSGNITVFNDGGEWKLKVEGIKDKKPKEGSFPYTIIMERKE